MTAAIRDKVILLKGSSRYLKTSPHCQAAKQKKRACFQVFFYVVHFFFFFLGGTKNLFSSFTYTFLQIAGGGRKQKKILFYFKEEVFYSYRSSKPNLLLPFLFMLYRKRKHEEEMCPNMVNLKMHIQPFVNISNKMTQAPPKNKEIILK